jgi:hypothetical protein
VDYGHAHQRLRAALLAAFTEGTPCGLCGNPMWRAQKLDLGHVSDADGRSIPGRWAGLQHATCNSRSGGQVNPWGVRTRAVAARARRSPARAAEVDAREARRQRKAIRSEYDAVQQQLVADESGREW